MQLWKLGCRWGSAKESKPLFYDFLIKHNLVIGWIDKDYGLNNWVLLTNGETVLGFAHILEAKESVLNYPQLEEDFKKLQLPFEKELFCYKAKIIELKEKDRFLYQLQQGICKVNNKPTIQKFNDLLLKYQSTNTSNTMNSETINLLKYKKQIILQGPPGTGKTRLAKKIAQKLLIEDLNKSFTKNDLCSLIKANQFIKTITGTKTFEVLRTEDNGFIIQPESSKHDYKILYDDIIESIKDYGSTDWLKKHDKKGVGSYIVGIAKYVVENSANKQHLIVQFHPSYTYEDFVRGIVAKPNEDGNGIVYDAEDKHLALWAKMALDNYLGFKGIPKHNSTFRSKLNVLIENIRLKIDAGQEYSFGDKSTAQIIASKEDGFLYSFPNRPEIKYKLLFNDLEKIYAVKYRIDKPIDLRDLQAEIGLLMKGKYPYYYMLLKQLELINVEEIIISDKIELKNYVIIIDEINRANLSSVLGELIYALEYRGEEVDSMYEVGGSNKLILPPNLYIIGTMNTADRSVGHIDYAIRRRFAFVDVPPQLLEDNEEIWFNISAYEAVKTIFTSSNVSSDFDVKDIQIGHSYFIVKKEDAKTVEEKDSLFRMKMKYEVVPILYEYVKDGILSPDTKNAIEKIRETYA